MVEVFIAINRDGVLHLLEQVLVIDNPAIFLVLAIEAVGAADGLKQAMVLHALVDVQDAAGGGVKAGQQLVDHDKELHAGGFFDKQPLCLGFVGLGA